MEYFSVVCDYDSVYTYNSSSCFRTGSWEANEECIINVLRDGALLVKTFDLQYKDSFLYGSTKWETYDDGPWSGMKIFVGDEFAYTSESSTTSWTTLGFDMCGVPAPTEHLELIGGSNAAEGVVYLNGQPICASRWGNNEANVVCKLLGFEYGTTAMMENFGKTYDDFIIRNLQCGGYETSIWDCSYETDIYMCGVWSGSRVRCGPTTATTWNEKIMQHPAIIPVIALICGILVCYLIRKWICKQWICKHNQQNQDKGTLIIGQAGTVGNVEMKNVNIETSTPNKISYQSVGASSNIHFVNSGANVHTGYVEPAALNYATPSAPVLPPPYEAPEINYATPAAYDLPPPY